MTHQVTNGSGVVVFTGTPAACSLFCHAVNPSTPGHTWDRRPEAGPSIDTVRDWLTSHAAALILDDEGMEVMTVEERRGRAMEMARLWTNYGYLLREV